MGAINGFILDYKESINVVYLNAEIIRDQFEGHLEDPLGPPMVIRPHSEKCQFMSLYTSQ